MKQTTIPFASKSSEVKSSDWQHGESSTWRIALGWIVLVGLLLLLCLRLTINEPIEDGAFLGSSSGMGAFTAQGYSSPGPLTILTCAVCSFCLSIAGIAGTLRISREKLWRLAGILLLCGWATVSALHASNKFAAMTGVFDLSMGILSGWTMAVVCYSDRRRQFAASILVGLLAVLCAKGFYEKYYELPTTLHYFYHHKAAFFAHMGWGPENPNVILFESRIKSQAVTGFLILSDSFAEVLLPLSLLCLPLSLFLFFRRGKSATVPIPTVSGMRKGHAVIAPKTLSAKQDIPPAIIPGIPILLLFIGSLAVLVFTLSKGGMASEAICLLIFLLGWLGRHWLKNHRWHTVIAAVLVVLTIAAGIVGWGLRHHGLPTKDLLYRWQYWTGAVRMVERHPLLGVGLNNFGYYYTRYKLPSAPEDVKDPHNPLVRLASEAGLPAALLWGLLVLAAFVAVVAKPEQESTDANIPKAKHVFPALFALFAVTWWMLQATITAPARGGPNEWTFIVLMAGIYAGVGFLGMVLANGAWVFLTSEQKRVAMLALALGGLGMCLYDQINLALVTGPVAMLLWMGLGTAQPRGNELSEIKIAGLRFAPHKPAGILLRRTGLAALCLATTASACLIWLPTEFNALPMNPAPWQKAYRIAVSTHNAQAALAAAKQVLRRKPRSQVWLGRKIKWEIDLRQNPRADVLRLLALNTTNARVRIGYAMTARSGLTIPERISQLRLALQLNSDLPKKELTRLNPAEVRNIQKEIAMLKMEVTSPATR